MNFSRDGRQLADRGDERATRLWNTANGRQERVSPTIDTIRIYRFTDGGQTLVTVVAEGRARLRAVGTGRLRAILPAGRIEEMALLATAHCAAVAVHDEPARQWQVRVSPYHAGNTPKRCCGILPVVTGQDRDPRT
ncbi:hypothetical protein [Actinoplanes sp. NPDC089786]|uniref:hypothetical protein n=1 Tax=Actinoplanes sp. NPDC089786 TaxID=3155185 RepID=UPI003444B89D